MSGRERGRTERSRAERSRTERPRVSPARLVAYDVLRDVEDREAYANLALPARIRDVGLAPRDAALATELAAGTLRWRGRYDRIIELASNRTIGEVDPRTRNVLRLGAHQLLAMRTAAHAAVNESVELQRQVANRAAAGFVNGVLRSIGREDGTEWDARIDATAPNADAALADRWSHPGWILRALRDALRGEGRAEELEALLQSNNSAPRVSLVRLPGGPEAPALDHAMEAGVDVRASGPSPIGMELGGGDPASVISRLDPGEGWIRVQDQGSQLAALALTRARPASVQRPERWLDLCAGPGGKTAILAAEARLCGATVRANEVSEHRVELVRRSITAVADRVDIVVEDGRDDAAFGGENMRFDRILLDAPCSGLGALRRRPEARWRKQPSDLPELTGLQSELLDAAIAHLAPGGIIAYVTCSPHRAETRFIVDAALKRHSALREMAAKPVIDEIVASGGHDPLDLPGHAPSVQLWPHRHGTDAMFISLLTLQ